MAATGEVRCHICRGPVSGKTSGKPMCERCLPLVKAPLCKVCGEPVRDARPGEEPYHDNCRRCSSCNQVVAKDDCVFLAGRLLCKPCDHLFGKFFLPDRRVEGDRMKETFAAWDTDGSGSIEKRELRRVLKALNPDIAERDLERLIEVIDKDRNGTIEYDEFVDWMMSGSSLQLPVEESFEGFVANLMHEAGIAVNQAKMGISEVQLRPDGVVFAMTSGSEKREATCMTSEELQMLIMDPEEFLHGIESTEEGLRLSTNTGKDAMLKVQGNKNMFGPWVAPEGFRIVGLRTKPDESGKGDLIVGVDLGPLPNAKHYDGGAALRFAAEHEFLFTLQRLLSKAQLDVNSFGAGGATALMLAAQNGSVASMRMLLGSKAKPGLTDVQGWTALTYASRFGRDSAVEILLDKKDKSVEDGDNGAALKEALRHQHNSAARALLRAGFGPAPRGTFALEGYRDDSKCTVEPPVLKPSPGVFSKPIYVELMWGELLEPLHHPDEDEEEDFGETSLARQDARASRLPDGMTILYTLDGRDPYTAGKRYMKRFKLSAPVTRVRAVAMKGKEVSKVIDVVYVVCHYVMPTDVVSGALQLRTFPEGFPILGSSIAAVVGEPEDRVTVETEDLGTPSASPKPKKGGKVWLRVPVSCPNPKHKMCINRSFALVRGDKKKGFLDRLSKDILQALGEAPQNLNVYADSSSMKSSHKAGATVVEFTLSRHNAVDLEEMLQDASSWLLTKAKLKESFNCADLQVMESLGDRLRHADFLSIVQSSLGVHTDEVVGLGSEAGDDGVVAVACASSEAAKIKKKGSLLKAVKENMPDTEQGEMKECSVMAKVKYTVDVVPGLRTRPMVAPRMSIAPSEPRAEDPMQKDGGTVVRELNSTVFEKRLAFQLKKDLLPVTEVNTDIRAASRELKSLQFRLEWGNAERKDKTSAGSIRDYLDGICMVYSGSQLVHVVDYKSSTEGVFLHDGQETAESVALSRAVDRAVQHSGDVIKSNGGGAHTIDVNMSALPLEVTDLFFVMSAFDADDLSNFKNPTVQIIDSEDSRTLSQYGVASAGKAQSVIMCSFSLEPNHKKWVVRGLGIPSTGNAKDYGPLREKIADQQASFLRWHRRKDIVNLRVLHMCERVTQGGTSNLAKHLWQVMELPTGVFQLMVSFL